MKLYDYLQAAKYCGFASKAGLSKYIDLGEFPKPVNSNKMGKGQTYYWREKDVIKGAKRVAEYRANRVRRDKEARLRQKEARISETLRERAAKKESTSGYDLAMKLMIAR